MEKRRGKFVVLYGNNNVGKSTQIALLEDKLKEQGVAYKKIKVPVYDLEPTGPVIFGILKLGHKKVSPLEFQKLYAQNRRDYEPMILKMLEDGYLLLAEDYVGTGLAWGVVDGVPLTKLEKINSDLLVPDLCLLLDGPRRIEAREVGHMREDGGNWEKSREVHLMLARKYGWKVIDGSRERREVSNDIWSALKPVLGVEMSSK